MEPWSYVSEEKGYGSNDTLSPPNTTLGRSKNSILGWELKTPCTFSNDMLAMGHQNIENQCFMDLGYPEMLVKHLSEEHDNRITSTTTTTVMAATPNPFYARGDSNFRVSNSNGSDSLIDLKLGRLDDHGDAIDMAFCKGASMLSSSESSMPAKRVRASGLSSQIAYCQVYGCNKDLSSCKDYHKRHRVCEVHSKTAIVTVNGIQQRFCQQCSRFHLLAEFDDGKRSCRKRLAGHNERRRKPQMGIHSVKAARFLQPCGDSKFQGTMQTSASYICPEIVPSGVTPSEKYGMSGFWNGYSQSRSLFPSYNQKYFPFHHENGATSTTGSFFSDHNIQYPPPVLISKNSGPRSLFHDTTSLGSEDFNIFETTSTVQGLSGIADSCALSLLSSQSQNSSRQSSGVPFANHFVIPSSHSHHYNMSRVSEKMGNSSHALSNRVPYRFPSEMNPADGNHLNPVLIPDNDNDDDIVNFGMADGIFEGSDFLNAKDCLPCEDGATINLLQLSSQLQRVEHQRQPLPVKQERDSFCTLRIT